MIDFSGRAARAGTRSIAVVAAASSFAVMSQLAPQQHAQADSAARAVAHKHDHDHDTAGRERARHEEGRAVRRRADLVVDTKGGPQGAILPGRTYKWPYEVTNKGSVPAKDVALTATPDRSLKVLAIPPHCMWRRTGRLICRIGMLPQGQTKRGLITASVVPKAVTGRALTSPVQVSWRNAPAAALRTAFPPARIYPAGKGTIEENADQVPYPVMQTEHGPVTAEAVVVRSSVAPCANSVIPARVVAGRVHAIKPDCGMLPNTPAPVPAADETNGKLGAVPCAVEPRHAVPAAGPECANVDRTAGVPCSALPADRPAQDRPAITPCAAAHPGDPCACGASPGSRPVADKAAADKAAAEKAAAEKAAADNAAAEKAAAEKAAADKAAADSAAAETAAAEKAALDDAQAAKPSGTSGVVVVPGSPVTLPCSTAVDRPIAAPSSSSVPPCSAAQESAGRPAARPDEHAAAQVPARPAPCGVVESPGIAQNAPVVPPCAAAHGLPGACSCLSSPQSLPAAAQGSPVTAAQRPVEPAEQAVPAEHAAPVQPCAAKDTAPCGGDAQDPAEAGPVNTDEADATPCGAADKPMAAGDTALPGKSAAPSCASVQGRPVAVPDTNVPITPLAGPGKSAHRVHPVRVPSLRGHAPHRAPHHLGRGHKVCVRQGSGFICPLGAVPPGHSHMRPVLHSRPGHPARMRCAGGDSAACHTRMARPVAGHSSLTARRLPSTGASSALLALCGLGLAGAGVVFYRVGRGRRSEG